MNIFENVFSGIRQYLLKNTSIISIVQGLSEFENVNSGQVILHFSSIIADKNTFFYLKDGIYGEEVKVSQNSCLKDELCRFILPSKNKFYKKCLNLSEIGKVSTGVNIGGASKIFLSNSKLDDNYLPFISTKTLKCKYQHIVEQGVYINFSKKLVDSVNFENKLKGSKNIVVLGDVERFLKEKIFIRQSAPEIVCSFDDQAKVSPYSMFLFNIYPNKKHLFSLKYVLAILNSSVITHYARENKIIKIGKGKQPQIRKKGLDQLLIKKPTSSEATLFEELVSMVQFTKREGMEIPAAFLEELIDACVLELYFPEEAAAKDLQFIDPVSDLLKGESEPSQTFIETFVATANAPDHPIRNKLDRLIADSPDLFAVIKQEGQV